MHCSAYAFLRLRCEAPMISLNSDSNMPSWLICLAVLLWFVVEMYNPATIEQCAVSCSGHWRYESGACECVKED